MPQLPADLPGLQEEAARLAKEYLSGIALYAGNDACIWEDLTPNEQRKAIDAYALLLRDLTRQASRDWALRWLATQAIPHATVGPFEGPAWYKYQNRWVLWFGDHSAHFSDSPSFAEKWRVYGIGAIDDPIEALAMVCAHVAKVTNAR